MKLRQLLVLASFVPIALMVGVPAVILYHGAATQSAQLLTHESAAELVEATALQASLAEYESNLRAYVFTSDLRFLQPLNAEMTELTAHLRALEALTANDEPAPRGSRNS